MRRVAIAWCRSTSRLNISRTCARWLNRSSSFTTSGRKSLPDSVLPALQIVERFFERVRALFHSLQAQRSSFALDRVHLTVDAVDLGAERRLFARRLLENRVHHLQRHVGVGEEAGQAVRLDVQDAQQQIELRLRLFLRLLQFARQHHALGHVVHRHQQVRQRAFGFHAVEIEFQEVRIEAAGRIVEVHFDFVQRVDGLDQLLVDALAPQQRDVVHRGPQRLLGDDVLEQLVERQVGELFAAEDVVERHRALATELQFLVEQEQAFVHRAQNVCGFFAGAVRDGFFLAEVTSEVQEDRAEQQQRRDHAADLNSAQRAGFLAAVLFNLDRQLLQHRRQLAMRAGAVLIQVVQCGLQATTARAQLHGGRRGERRRPGLHSCRWSPTGAGAGAAWVVTTASRRNAGWDRAWLCSRPTAWLPSRSSWVESGVVMDGSTMMSPAASEIMPPLASPFSERSNAVAALRSDSSASSIFSPFCRRCANATLASYTARGCCDWSDEEFDARDVVRELASLAVVHGQDDRDEHQESGDREHDSFVST